MHTLFLFPDMPLSFKETHNLRFSRASLKISACCHIPYMVANVRLLCHDKFQLDSDHVGLPADSVQGLCLPGPILFTFSQSPFICVHSTSTPLSCDVSSYQALTPLGLKAPVLSSGAAQSMEHIREVLSILPPHPSTPSQMSG